MKLFKLLALMASNIAFSTIMTASAPAHQSMDLKQVVAIAVENVNLQHKLNKQSSCTCCDILGRKCNNVGNRIDNLLLQKITNTWTIATCQTDAPWCDGRNAANNYTKCCAPGSVTYNAGKLVAASTCFLPCTLVAALCCGTTYVCCSAQCSQQCLGLRN